MMRHIIFYFILLFYFYPLLWRGGGKGIASDNTPLGARYSGMGNAAVSLSDVWSVQNNQAGLGFVKKINGGVYYQNQFMLKELSTKAFSFSMPTKSGTFGICISNFGYSLFSQKKYGVAFGKAFGDKISAGIMMGYLETAIADYGKKGIPVAEAGLQAKPMKNFTLGVHLFNITRTKLASYNHEPIPTIMRLGVNYKFSGKVFMVLETEKDMDKKAIAKAGLEYNPLKEVYLRAGVSTNPSLSCFGIGVDLNQFKLDLSSTYHSTFGFSPQVGLTYEFNAPNKNKTN
jgi:hypothetical protein